ncbi:hypothetical protein CR513_46166, partial [Mucuna pruriens]
MVFVLNMWRHYLYGLNSEEFKCLKNFGVTLNYHLGKANVVVNPKSTSLGMLKITSSLLDEIWTNHFLARQVEAITQGKVSSLEIREDGVVRLKGRVCVPSARNLRKLILEEGYKSNLSVQFQIEITCLALDFAVVCTKLRLSSTYHSQTNSHTKQTIQSYKISLKLHLMKPYMAKAARLLCVDLSQLIVWCYDLREHNYHNMRMKDLEFKERDHVFLKVTPWTRVGRALKSHKFSPRFIGPYQILKRVDKVTYQIALPLILSNLYDVFHVSQL